MARRAPARHWLLASLLPAGAWLLLDVPLTAALAGVNGDWLLLAVSGVSKLAAGGLGGWLAVRRGSPQ